MPTRRRRRRRARTAARPRTAATRRCSWRGTCRAGSTLPLRRTTRSTEICEAGLAGRLLRLLGTLQRRVHDVARLRRHLIVRLAGDLLDPHAAIRGVHRHRHRRGAGGGADQDPVLRLVLEHEVGAAVGDGRVHAHRVVRDVPGVVDAGADRQARVEGGVEHRRRDLADAAADRRQQQPADDRLALLEAALRRARPDALVERERRARLDHLAVEDPRHQLHVEDAVRRRGTEVGGDG